MAFTGIRTVDTVQEVVRRLFVDVGRGERLGDQFELDMYLPNDDRDEDDVRSFYVSKLDSTEPNAIFDSMRTYEVDVRFTPDGVPFKALFMFSLSGRIDNESVSVWIHTSDVIAATDDLLFPEPPVE